MGKAYDGKGKDIKICGEKLWKLLKVLLLLGSALAALKLIFVDYTLDEEYQIVMAYRNLRGDHLFKQMWEPHQTSAFLCTALIWIYMALTGTTTGVVLFLRFFTLGVQVGLAYAVYRTLVKNLEKEYAFLLAILYFNIVPKNIQIPEFSNMQLWFLVISLLLMMKYYDDRERKDGWYLLIGVGAALAVEILTYPSCIILFPFLLIYIWRKSGEKAERSNQNKWRDMVLLTATCIICAGLWLVMIFRHVTIPEFLQNVGKLLSVDPTHDVSGMTTAKKQNYIENIGIWGIWVLVISAISVLLTVIIRGLDLRKEKKLQKREYKIIFWILNILLAEGVQLYYWAVVGIGYEYLQIHLLMIYMAAAVAWRSAGEGRNRLWLGIVGTLVAYVGVMYISDLAMYYALPHGALGIVFSVGIILLAAREKRRLSLLLVVSLCICAIFGKAYTLRGGKEENTIRSVGGIMKDGPAAGILADYMCAYIYNCNYEDYAEYVQEGDNVLIVANMVMSVGTTAYLFEDVNVAHYSVVDPTTYDENLLMYWQQYPEKKPNVIVVDCWYGELKENPDSWIMKYIEGDFGYTSVEDGRYVRFYRSENIL